MFLYEHKIIIIIDKPYKTQGARIFHKPKMEIELNIPFKRLYSAAHEIVFSESSYIYDNSALQAAGLTTEVIDKRSYELFAISETGGDYIFSFAKNKQGGIQQNEQ